MRERESHLYINSHRFYWFPQVSPRSKADLSRSNLRDLTTRSKEYVGISRTLHHSSLNLQPILLKFLHSLRTNERFPTTFSGSVTCSCFPLSEATPCRFNSTVKCKRFGILQGVIHSRTRSVRDGQFQCKEY